MIRVNGRLRGSLAYGLRTLSKGVLTAVIGLGCSRCDNTRQTEPKSPVTAASVLKPAVSASVEVPTPAKPAADTLITWEPVLIHEMNGHDASEWEMANWSNGSVFNNTWRPDHVRFENGIMSLVLDNAGCPQSCDGKPFASGEYRTAKEIHRYGYYETRMKAEKGVGLVAGTFFVYSGVYGKASHNEIDFEVLGNDPTKVQLNYYYAGHGKDQEYKRMVDLGFDASQTFANYGFEWRSDSIVWYVNGRPVHTAAENIPQGKTKIMANFWPAKDVGNWVGGDFKYPGKSLHVDYDWMKYSPLVKPGDPQGKKPAPVVTSEPPTAPVAGALTLEKIGQGNFDFNGGKVSYAGSVYTFSATSAKDPGFGILTGNADVSSNKTLKFEIKGSLTNLGGYAHFIAQVYSDKDDDYTPAVSLDPVALTNDFTTHSLKLNGQVQKAKKVQFLLVTDKGSCQVEIKNLRFE